MSEVRFTSSLPAEHRDDIERLLFFNGNQAKVVGSVGFVTQRYGVPRIRVVDERVRIGLDPHEPQTLFAVELEDDEPHPIGVIIYVREDDALVVLFVAVDEAFSSQGEHAGVGLLRLIMAELQGVARRVRGIGTVAVYLGRTTPTRIAVKRDAPTSF